LTDYPIVEMQKAITRIMDRLNMNPPQQSTDPNMSIAYECAQLMGTIDSLPESLKEMVVKRVKYLDFVDKNMISGLRLWEFNNQQQIESFLANIDEKSIPWIYDIVDSRKRINITLRLWAGGLDAAKSLRKVYVSVRSYESVSEEAITPDMPTTAFRESIDPKALSDPVYYAGVEAAPILKKLRNEKIYTDGIPADSPVMNYLNT
jgi:hypothetical protein